MLIVSNFHLPIYLITTANNFFEKERKRNNTELGLWLLVSTKSQLKSVSISKYRETAARALQKMSPDNGNPVSDYLNIIIYNLKGTDTTPIRFSQKSFFFSQF